METTDKYLTVAELCDYLKISKSAVYKLTHYKIIPKYCPNGKLILFKRSDIDSWVEGSRISSVTEIENRLNIAA